MAFAEELKKDFQNLIARGRLFHSYLFFGEAQEVQYQFAQAVANYLENKKWVSPERVLLDALFITNETGIEAARSISAFLWQKPIKSARKTLVIHRADRLTVPAQNAILKITEEPPEHALIILTLRDPGAVLLPLASRFQRVYISDRFASSETFEHLKSSPAQKLVKQFLNAYAPKEKTEIIKSVIEDNQLLEDFVTILISYFRQDLLKNWKILKNLLQRWTLINVLNTNKRLQLEAALIGSR